MSEYNDGGANAFRSGRRAASAPGGFDPYDPYVKEVLDLAAKKPGAAPGEDVVDFDRLIAEEDEATPDFEALAAREALGAGNLGGFAVYGEPARSQAQAQPGAPAVRRPPPAAGRPAPAGTMADIPVYGEPVRGAMAEIPVYGEPVPGAMASIPVYGEPAAGIASGPRSLNVKDRPDFYDDPSATVPSHDVRFRPGSSYSSGNRNAYRTDSRGVPVFAPGWNAAQVAAVFAQGRNIRIGLTALMIAGSVAAGVAGVGSNAEYRAFAENGVQVQGTVMSVVSESAQQSADEASVDSLGVTTTESASVEFVLNGSRHRHELTAVSDDGAALVGAAATWPQGSTVDLIVDPADPSRAVVADPDQRGRVNILTFIPLVPALLFGCGAVIAHLNARKMRRIAVSDAAEAAAAES